MKNKCKFKLTKRNCTYWPEFKATCPNNCPNSIVPHIDNEKSDINNNHIIIKEKIRK